MEQIDTFPEENSNAIEIVKWASRKYETNAIFACSFSAEDMVILHMIVTCRDAGIQIPEVITLDTGRLHEETYAVMQSAKEKYGIEFKALHPDANALSELVSEYGPNLFYKSVELRQRCCNVRKTLPLNTALENKLAWITGLRREQSPERSQVKKISRDVARNGIIKINPIADWNAEEVWSYIRQHDVPYNSLHDKGFPSIGCAPCTRAVLPGEDIRAGRWWWEGGKKECGIHELSLDPRNMISGR
ncbi:MAG: phosphoadenylyl-sulfate reductase [Candidatus Thermoplasmatota archaeon]|nr:phosphoadenylyl-sulfate reductase [Candidatus Thermoplasmatota archaeon]